MGDGAITNQPDQDYIVIEGVAPIEPTATWRPRVTAGHSLSLQVGDTSFQAFFVARFNPDLFLPDSFRIDSMVYVLRKNRVWPPSGAADLPIVIREVTEKWYEDSLLAGTLAGKDSFRVIGTMTATVGPLDTLQRFTIPQDVWEPWLVDDTTKWGILLEPAATGTLIDFYSREGASGFQSVLCVYGIEYRDSSGIIVDTALLQTVSATADGFLAYSHAQDETPQRLKIEQGAPRRAAFYFPLDTVSEVYSRQVNRADLLLYADQTNAENFSYPQEVLSFKSGSLQDTAWFAIPDSAKLQFIATEPSYFDSSNTVVAFDVTGIVADWVINPDHNAGMQIQSALETGFLGRHVFHGPGTEDPAKRPRLVIWFSER